MSIIATQHVSVVLCCVVFTSNPFMGIYINITATTRGWCNQFMKFTPLDRANFEFFKWKWKKKKKIIQIRLQTEIQHDRLIKVKLNVLTQFPLSGIFGISTSTKGKLYIWRHFYSNSTTLERLPKSTEKITKYLDFGIFVTLIRLFFFSSLL